MSEFICLVNFFSLQVYYHLGSFEDSLTYALGAEDLLDVNGHSEYVETIIGTQFIITKWITPSLPCDCPRDGSHVHKTLCLPCKVHLLMVFTKRSCATIPLFWLEKWIELSHVSQVANVWLSSHNSGKVQYRQKVWTHQVAAKRGFSACRGRGLDAKLQHVLAVTPQSTESLVQTDAIIKTIAYWKFCFSPTPPISLIYIWISHWIIQL